MGFSLRRRNPNRWHLVQEELPRIVNDLRPIVWVEKQGEGSSLCLTIRTRFASVEKPMLHSNQILLPLQAQQLNRSYNGRLLLNVEIIVKQITNNDVIQQYAADVQDLCVGIGCFFFWRRHPTEEIPVLVGSCLCHRRANDNMCFFIVNGQCKVIVSQEQFGHGSHR